MAKNPLITNEVRKVIANIYLEHSDWRAKEIRDAVEARLHKINPRSKPGWPGLSAVQKELTKQRKTDDARPPESKALDQPWSLGKITERDLPIESIPVILGIQEYRRLKGKEPLTIRQAWWLSRIYSVISQPEVLSTAEVLLFWARVYASSERIAELTKTERDTSDLDRIVSNYSEEYAAYPDLFDAILGRGTMGIDDIGSTLNYILKLRKLVTFKEKFPEDTFRKEYVEKRIEKYISYLDQVARE